MRLYELMVVLKPSLKDADRKKVLDTVREWLKSASPSQGGDVKVKKEIDLGQKPLAYTIKKEVAGHYYQLMLESDLPEIGTGEGGVAKDFEQKLIRNENILRHLLLRTK